MAEKKIIAFCGLLCNECPAFIAKRTDDDELREKTAERWSTEEFPLEPEDINCDGCVHGEEILTFCTVCGVRRCGVERGVENCAYCVEYPCKKLENPWSHNPEAKERLDAIRKGC